MLCAMTVGVLALQGDFAEHLAVLTSLNVHVREVRSSEDLTMVDALVIPGGESTVMSRFLHLFAMDAPIKARAAKGMPIFGTCAGAILLGKEALGKHAPKTLGLLDMDVDRNAYGSQVDSFDATLNITGIQTPVTGAFIRAPILARVGKGIEILATHDGKPVCVRQGAILAATFHPEVRGQAALHKLFLRMVTKKKPGLSR